MTVRSDPALLDDLRRVALQLADAAAPRTLAHFRSREAGLTNKANAGFDPVTEGDRAAERAMRDIIAAERPRDAILGEEFGEVPGTSGLTWVLDPIDGTRAYIAGAPTWGTLVAVADRAGPILGLIDQPYTSERFFGGGGAAWMDGPRGRRDLGVRKAARLDDAILCSTFPEIGTPADRTCFARLASRVRMTRYGLDCYAYALLAAGHVDLVVEAGLQPYDIQGPMAVIEAAGGIVTTWDGGRADDGGRVLAAANADLHREAMDLLG